MDDTVSITIKTNTIQVPEFYLKEIFPYEQELSDNRRKGTVTITLVPK